MDADGEFREADGLAIYLQVVPAEAAGNHPPEHTGRGLHGGAPPGGHNHHILVGLIDAATRTRIGGAEVKAVLAGVSHGSRQRIALAPMTVDGAEAYGGFVPLHTREFYRIEIEVTRAGRAPAGAVFHHQQLQP